MPAKGRHPKILGEVVVVLRHTGDHICKHLFLFRSACLPHPLCYAVLRILRLNPGLQHRVTHVHNVALHVVFTAVVKFLSYTGL